MTVAIDGTYVRIALSAPCRSSFSLFNARHIAPSAMRAHLHRSRWTARIPSSNLARRRADRAGPPSVAAVSAAALIARLQRSTPCLTLRERRNGDSTAGGARGACQNRFQPTTERDRTCKPLISLSCRFHRDVGFTKDPITLVSPFKTKPEHQSLSSLVPTRMCGLAPLSGLDRRFRRPACHTAGPHWLCIVAARSALRNRTTCLVVRSSKGEPAQSHRPCDRPVNATSFPGCRIETFSASYRGPQQRSPPQSRLGPAHRQGARDPLWQTLVRQFLILDHPFPSPSS